MTERLKIEVSTLPSRRGQVALVVLAGVLDAQTVEAFEAAVEGATHDAAMVVLELRALTWISSAGAGALLVASRRAAQRGGGLVLAQPGRQVQDVLTALGLTTLLPIGNTLEEAVAQLRTGAHVKPGR